MANYSNKTTGTIDANGEIVAHATRFLAPGVVSVQVAGTFTGTIQIEASLDGTNFKAFQMLDSATLYGGSPTAYTSVTATHVLCGKAYAVTYIRLRASAWSTGSADITIVSVDG